MSTPFSSAMSASVLPPHSCADNSSAVMPSALAAASNAAWLCKPRGPNPLRGAAGAVGADGVGVTELCADATELIPNAATMPTSSATPTNFLNRDIVHLHGVVK